MGTLQTVAPINNVQSVIYHVISALTMEMLATDPDALPVPRVLIIVTVLFSNVLDLARTASINHLQRFAHFVRLLVQPVTNLQVTALPVMQIALSTNFY
jgi:hypothetical protein